MQHILNVIIMGKKKYILSMQTLKNVYLQTKVINLEMLYLHYNYSSYSHPIQKNVNLNSIDSFLTFD